MDCRPIIRILDAVQAVFRGRTFSAIHVRPQLDLIAALCRNLPDSAVCFCVVDVSSIARLICVIAAILGDLAFGPAIPQHSPYLWLARLGGSVVDPLAVS